jgi:hypothetical protein
LFDDPNKITHDVLRHIFKFIEKNPLSELIKNIEPLKSKFLKMFSEKARKNMAPRI